MPPTAKPTSAKPLPERAFRDAAAWEAWLEKHQASSPGLWVKIAKKGAGIDSVTYDEAVEVALCHGWIDGQKMLLNSTHWQQKFTPRGKKSLWSKKNCGRVEGLIEGGRMRPAGLATVEAAKSDGRWQAAYDSPKNLQIHPEFAAALEASPKAKEAFARISAADRYAVHFRLQTVKKAETRAKRVAQFVANLESGRPIRDT
jgi:uncharacterized protein YdeI (YjbR/CyaY-like superfamily)